MKVNFHLTTTLLLVLLFSSTAFAQWSQLNMTSFPKQDFTCKNATVYEVAASATKVYIGTEKSGVYSFDISAATGWTLIDLPVGSSPICSGSRDYGIMIYALTTNTDATGDVLFAGATNGKVYRSLYGATFTEWSTGLPGSGYINDLLVVENTIFAGHSNGNVYYRDLAGTSSWTSANSGLGIVYSLDYKTVVKMVGGGSVYHLQIGSGGGVYTRKLGTGGVPVTGFWNRNLVDGSGTALTCHELLVNRDLGALADHAILAEGSDGSNALATHRLYRSIGNTAGTTWEEVNTINNDINAQLAWSPDKLLVAYHNSGATLNYLDKSTDAGDSWPDANETGLVEDRIYDLAYSGPYIFAGTHKNGVYKIDVSTLRGVDLSNQFELNQNVSVYPTLLSVGTTEITIVSVNAISEAMLFSSEGKLIQEFYAEGIYEATTMKINTGQLQPGMYILRINTESGWESRKLIVQ